MKSVAMTVSFETLYRNRWRFLFGLVWTNVLPLALFFLFRSQGLDPHDPAMQLFLVRISMITLIAGLSLVDVDRTAIRLSIYPISNSAALHSTLLPGILLSSTLVFLSLVLQNWAMDQSLPLIGPTLFAALGISVCWVSYSCSRNFTSMALAIILASGLGLWYFIRFAMVSGSELLPVPDASWLEISVLTLLCVMTIQVGVIAFGRLRCGETLIPELALSFGRDHTFRNSNATDFTSAIKAQCWRESTRKGWLLPMITAICLTIGLCSWLINGNEVRELDSIALGCGMIGIYFGAILGLLQFGNMNSEAIRWKSHPGMAHFKMGHFLASRPISNAALAKSIMLVVGKSLLISWLIWLAFFTCVQLVNSRKPWEIFVEKGPAIAGWWFFPATLLSAWALTMLTTSTASTGSRSASFWSVFVSGIVMAVFGTSSQFFLSNAAREAIAKLVLIAISVGLIANSIWIFSAALRRSYVTWKVIICCAFLFSVVAIGNFVQFRSMPHVTWQFLLLMVGVSTLVVLPVAGLPLAIEKNRTQ